MLGQLKKSGPTLWISGSTAVIRQAMIHDFIKTSQAVPDAQVRAMRSVLYCAWPRMLWLRHDGAEPDLFSPKGRIWPIVPMLKLY